MEALTDQAVSSYPGLSNDGIQSRLRVQMRADALRPLNQELDEEVPDEFLAKEIFTPETIDEAHQFLRLNVCVNYFLGSQPY